MSDCKTVINIKWMSSFNPIWMAWSEKRSMGKVRWIAMVVLVTYEKVF